jgi:cellulose synthase/poly-beta-1,6-N-acetylglucosamine synthase-like glycosyltransferase
MEGEWTSVLPKILGVIYCMASLGLFFYGLNCYVMVALFQWRRKGSDAGLQAVRERIGDLMQRPDAPRVTTQIACYNEYNVAERCIRAVCAMRYPAGRHEVQVVDDSNDETRGLVDRVTAELRAAGHDVRVVRREHRQGYKAGALDNALRQSRGEFIAVFDADFVPPEDYLLKTVPFFMADPRVGMVQARWGHLNHGHSLLTTAQAVGIDGHFVIEQCARNWNGLFMNFNGTAGLWRRQAIEDGGGWAWDTLTEDMDLSYRVQLANWQTKYVPDVVVPAEIPEDVRAFKSQQFRWAKGSIQTALKVLPALMRAQVSPFKKVQAFFHLTHYLVHPMMLALAVLALPVLLWSGEISVAPVAFAAVSVALSLSMFAPSLLYVVSQQAVYTDWKRRCLFLPLLIVIGVGIALSNTRGVMEALLGRESGFVRTPKKGDKEIKRYTVPVPMLAYFEILLGLYCAVSLGAYTLAGRIAAGQFMAIYAAGFLYIGTLTIVHSRART